MNHPPTRGLVGLLALLLLAACSPQSATTPGQAESPRRSGPSRVVATIMDDPVVMSAKLSAPSIRGADALEELVHVGLATQDHSGGLIAMLSEAVPSLDNGLWTVFPDGAMETTYRIRDGARWHDGRAFTAEDLAFTAAIAHDREVPDLRDSAFDSITSAT